MDGETRICYDKFKIAFSVTPRSSKRAICLNFYHENCVIISYVHVSPLLVIQLHALH
jgi:hypothetical protein